MAENAHVNANVGRWYGFAETYDRYRPQPPAAVVDLLKILAQKPLNVVVDLGAGTGLSSRIWAGHAKEVIGIEPNPDMRKEAGVQTEMPDVVYRAGLSTSTGLEDGCADLVTISQALHWMEPEPTFIEVARILRPEGVFAAYDCDWPPAVHWQVEQAYNECMERAVEIEAALGLRQNVTQWAKDEHLGRIRASGQFRYVREVTLHSVEMGNADRLVGLAISQARVSRPLMNGASEEEIGLAKLREVARRTLGDDPQPWYFSYRVRIGIK
ncbi:class I SAM-dependent methyltransferase [Aggregatilinea lenta]|uniref:class I SAM-dependent methyltransferase n=1 Tax=Aggregatilinea lenta TaxID=913108 RepID=UPI000E5B4026|nr:class I SAM-dependent methyltransferase [Aggregatilinea lenta]